MPTDPPVHTLPGPATCPWGPADAILWDGPFQAEEEEMGFVRVPHWALACREGVVHVLWRAPEKKGMPASLHVTFHRRAGRTKHTKTVMATTSRKLKNLTGANKDAVLAVVTSRGWHPSD